MFLKALRAALLTRMQQTVQGASQLLKGRLVGTAKENRCLDNRCDITSTYWLAVLETSIHLIRQRRDTLCKTSHPLKFITPSDTAISRIVLTGIAHFRRECLLKAGIIRLYVF